EERQRIDRALEALPEHHRTIIMLSDLQGLAYKEIAEVLQIPIGTVMSRLHNARKRLKNVLGPMLALLLAVLVALAPAIAQAQKPVRFGARVLLATDGPPSTSVKPNPEGADERLERFLPRLKQLFRYSHYTSVDRHRAEVPVGATQKWTVPGDRTLELTPERVEDSTVYMRARLMRGGVAEVTTNIQAARGNPAVIGGPRWENGVLIIIVWANANP
ncbi:MAG: sigma-70 family RNA polymerase sigma factor, partial [Candidatus Rokubacteria bacterium]|nr:sigma-70 family RNA polymerase sigma factor [Candidatus Rokubacteria bacterium]